MSLCAALVRAPWCDVPGNFTVTRQTPRGNPLGRSLNDRLKRLEQAELKARQQGAREATRVTRQSFTYVRKRGGTPPRAGRSSTGGQMMRHMTWRASVNDSLVEFDASSADRAAPQWIIQEIGTSERATLRRAGVTNPRGRPSRNAQHVRTVKSQRGRLISRALTFGTTSGTYVPPSRARFRRDEIQLRQNLRGGPRMRNARAIVITREIKGQHFVQRGGQVAAQDYKRSVLAAARSTFAGQRYRP